ncbi:MULTISPECIES: hypothetical protein [Rhodomicrobium]|uniref:hypothetical protein n=1 Tax=Rhodomicrobium TaxID=1068 RepID=UPI000B4A9F74|nr:MULTISPECIES: hypothetical protein [Rhodomicrobium]
MTIENGGPRQSITLRIRDVTVVGVLRELRQTYGFEIAGLAEADQGEAIAASMSGSLYDVLARLLRNRDHVIVRSAENASGVEKVILLAKGGKPPPAIGANPPSSHD